MTTDAALVVPVLEARIDKLTQALLHVAGELWVARDRHAVLERLLAERGVIDPSLIDSYRPDEALSQRLAAERETFVSTILSYLAPDS